MWFPSKNMIDVLYNLLRIFIHVTWKLPSADYQPSVGYLIEFSNVLGSFAI